MKDFWLRQPSKYRSDHRQQQGIALLTALFVVALVSVAAAAVYASQSLALKRTSNQLDGEQAWNYALGLEGLVRNILAFDLKKTPDTDSPGDIWATDGVVFPVQNGTLSGRIVDLQGTFNLNNLSLPSIPPNNNLQVELLGKLIDQVITQFNVPSVSRNGQRRGTGPEVADAIADWIDADSTPTGTSGAEDSEYLSTIPAMRTAGRTLLDVSEIRGVKGMTPELYMALIHCGKKGESCISALPIKLSNQTNQTNTTNQTNQINTAGPTAINVNTAPLILLVAMGADANKIKLFEATRVNSPIKNVADIRDPVKGILPPLPAALQQLNPLPVTVKSSWFRLESVSAVGGTQLAMYSTVFRPTSGPSGVYYRSTAPG